MATPGTHFAFPTRLATGDHANPLARAESGHDAANRGIPLGCGRARRERNLVGILSHRRRALPLIAHAVGIAADLDANREISDSRVISAFDLTSTLEVPKRFGPVRDASPLDQTNFNNLKE